MKAFALSCLMCTYIQEEELEKACEACKCPKALHTVTHEFLRLPAVLALHLKRFSFTDTLRCADSRNETIPHSTTAQYTTPRLVMISVCAKACPS